MIICVDVGNTTIEVGLFVKDKLVFSFKQPTHAKKSKSNIKTYLKEKVNSPVEYVVYSSVVPSVDTWALKLLHVYKNTPIIVVNKNGKLNFKIKVNKNQVIGSDLIADLVGAKAMYKSPVLIFDLGTAVKALLLDKNGDFASALICPGIAISLNSLCSSASLLESVNLHKVKPLLKTVETKDAINGGTIYSHASMIEGIVSRYEKELGYKVNVIITGGDASVIKDYINIKYIYDEHLLLEGLYKYGKDNL